jgi:hypothetical protein
MSSVWQRHGIGLEFKNERGNGDPDVAADRARHLLQSTSDTGAGVPQATQSPSRDDAGYAGRTWLNHHMALSATA